MITLNESLQLYHDLLSDTSEDESKIIMRRLCKTDLFFLLSQVLNRKDVIHPWIYDRIREVEASPDGHIDLWAREHYKSTIITFGLSISDIIKDPNVTIGIFSHTQKIAKGFLNQIKLELQDNEMLKGLFPEIFYEKPQTKAPRWGEGGILVKRESNPKEATVEAHGLVDSQPTSTHFQIRVYDDVVAPESVGTPDQMRKTTDAWRLSLNLGTRGGKERYAGTRYHFNDTYKDILELGTIIPRIHPATHDKTMEGIPVLLTKEELEKKRAGLGPFIFSCQMLLNPIAEGLQVFDKSWINFYSSKSTSWRSHNIYILIDPANSKSKRSDYTAIIVVGMGPDDNYYIIDMYRDRWNLVERTQKIFELHKQYRPIRIGYEIYGMQTDIEHIREKMDQYNYRFKMAELRTNVSKADRIKQLVPLFEQSKIWLPRFGEILHTDSEGKQYDPIRLFVNDELLAFPVCVHDDVLDIMARILDKSMRIISPLYKEIGAGKPTHAEPYNMFGR